MGGKPFLRRSGPDRLIDGKMVTPRVLIHPCQVEGCERDGGFGFKVDLRRGEVGEWYCSGHRHLGERLYASSTHSSDHSAEGEPDDREPDATGEAVDGA